MKKAVTITLLLFVVLASGALLLFGKNGYAESEKRLAEARAAMDAGGFTVPDGTEDAVRKNGAGNGFGKEDSPGEAAAPEKIPAEFFGRLLIPQTGTDLPVMQPPKDDPEKYLHRDMNGRESAYGSVYAVPGTDLSTPCLMLCGHHMKNGAMFGRIGELENGARVILVTENGTRTYAVTALFSVTPEEEEIVKALSLRSEKDGEQLAAHAQKTGRLYRRPVPGKRYLVLVTCEYKRPGERLVVLCEEL